MAASARRSGTVALVAVSLIVPPGPVAPGADGSGSGGVVEWSGMGATSGWRPPTWGVIGAGALIGGLVAWTTRPALALDDAAISFRYAERLATGKGLTYNDGEHVLGASSGLHT